MMFLEVFALLLSCALTQCFMSEGYYYKQPNINTPYPCEILTQKYITLYNTSLIQCIMACTHDTWCKRFRVVEALGTCDYYHSWVGYPISYFTDFPCKLYEKISCPPGYQLRPKTDSCQKLLLGAWSWLDALEMCSKDNAFLALIDSNEKKSGAKKYLDREPIPNRNLCTHMWLGAQRADPNDVTSPFVWTFGHGTSTPMDFTDWATNEPSTGSLNQCMAMSEGPGYKWYATDCADLKCALCTLEMSV